MSPPGFELRTTGLVEQHTNHCTMTTTEINRMKILIFKACLCLKIHLKFADRFSYFIKGLQMQNIKTALSQCPLFRPLTVFATLLISLHWNWQNI